MIANGDETIRRIEELGGSYDPESTLSLQDQLLICETLLHSTPVDPTDVDGRLILRLREEEDKRNGSDNGSVNGGCKRRVNFELTESKQRAIFQLNNFTNSCTPLEIERCLNEIFIEYPSKDGWWLYIAQHWTQRQINWVIREVLKLSSTGRITKDAAACFTFLIMKRKRRKAMGGI